MDLKDREEGGSEPGGTDVQSSGRTGSSKRLRRAVKQQERGVCGKLSDFIRLPFSKTTKRCGNERLTEVGSVENGQGGARRKGHEHRKVF